MMNSIQTYMAACPFLSEVDMNINYLGEDAVSGAVENVSAKPVVKNYTDGGSMRQYLFAISLRQPYGQNLEANSEAISLLEQISDWIEEQDRIGVLPALDEGKNSVSLEVFQTGLLEEKATSTAKFQLQCRLVYYQD